MEVTAGIRQAIDIIAAQQVDLVIAGQVREAERERDLFETQGDPDLEAQKASHYGALLDVLQAPLRRSSAVEELKGKLIHRVATAPEPAIPAPPRLVDPGDLVNQHPRC